MSLDEIFEAYESCRKNKRRTANAVAFEIDYESNLVALWRDINGGTYTPGASLAFVVDKPVKREIFAAGFRDRVVHHLIINKVNHLFEREFIYDSYACRVGKGTHLGIRRVDRFIRRSSHNYARDAYILKLDIKGFFMSINRKLLFDRLAAFLRTRYHLEDRELLIDLCRKVIFSDPAKHSRVRGRREDWDRLPRDKSLFHAHRGCGLPIGNLTSQVFANFYLNPLDHYLKHSLGIRFYGRYVDDFVIVHEDRSYLAALIPVIRSYLRDTLRLTLHPKKVYLQHYNRGVAFLGTVIKPNRIYVARRTKRNFAAAVDRHNRIACRRRPRRAEHRAFQSSINSYLGILRHYATWRLRVRMLERISPWWWKVFRYGADAAKVDDRVGGHRRTVEQRGAGPPAGFCRPRARTDEGGR